MDVYRVILLMMLVSSGVFGSPQWQKRQSNLSSPLSMGMRFLDNIRSGMTRTIGRIFGNGGGPQGQGKEVPHARPVRPKLPPPPPAPPAQVHGVGPNIPVGPQVHNSGNVGPNVIPVGPQVHNSGNIGQHPGTESPSSFFTVLHDNSGPATPFPEIQGFTDESFKPSAFLTGDTPFQGTVEEETLPFQTNDIHSPRPVAVHETQGPSFAVFQDGQSPPAHGEVFHASAPARPSFDDSTVSIPFGNTNHFSLGHNLREGPSQLPLAPRPTFTHEDFQARGDQISHQVPQEHQHSVILTSRADHEQKAKPFTNPKTKIPAPLPSVVKPTTTAAHHTEPPHEFTTFKVTHSDKTTTTQKSTPPAVISFSKEPPKPRVHVINTSTKRRISPKPDGSEEETEVSSYEFGYGVLDNDTGNQFFHAEKREEGLTKGSYKIQLPDGRIQTVTYRADNDGFHPLITYEGQAQYPKDVPKENP